MKIQISVKTEGTLVRTYSLNKGHYNVGSRNSDLCLLYPTVSAQHGRIEIEDSKVFFTDLGSRNGSKLEREKLLARQRYFWSPQQTLHVGPFQLSWRMTEKSIERTQSDLKNETEFRSEKVSSKKAVLLQISELYAKLSQESPRYLGERFQNELDRQFGFEVDEREEILDRVHAEFNGHGPLKKYISNPLCKEILINKFDEIYIDEKVGPRKLESGFMSPKSFEAWAMRMVHQCGRRLDLQNPICEATLPDGARFHAVLPPISVHSISVSIRRFGCAPLSEEEALKTGWIEPQALKILKQIIYERRNLVISGGTSTGKTSLLNFLCQYISPNERIITVEDTVELQPPIKNLIQLQARKPNADGVGQVSLRDLVQCALRMRPDRIIVGECRGPEVLDMLQVMNTGHPGSLTTIHANSAEDAKNRLELLALLGAHNLSIESIQKWIDATIDVFVQVERNSKGHRYIKEVSNKNEILYSRQMEND